MKKHIPFTLIFLLLITLSGITAGNLLERERSLSIIGTSVERRITEDGIIYDIRDSGNAVLLRKIFPDGTLAGYITLSKEKPGKKVTVAHHIFAVESNKVFLYSFEQPDASDKRRNAEVLLCDTDTWEVRRLCGIEDESDIIFTDKLTGGYLYFGYLREGGLDICRINEESGLIYEWQSIDAPFPVSWFAVTGGGDLYAASPDSKIYRDKDGVWETVFDDGGISSIAQISCGGDGELYVFLTGTENGDKLFMLDNDVFVTVREDIAGLFGMNVCRDDTWIGITGDYNYRFAVSGEERTISRLDVPFEVLRDTGVFLVILLESAVSSAVIVMLYLLRRRRKVGLIIKLAAVTAPIFVLGAFLLLHEMSAQITSVMYKDIDYNLLSGAKTAAKGIDVRRFAMIDWNDPLSDEYFLELRNEMKGLSEADEFTWYDEGKPANGQTYINYWIYRVDGGSVYFAVCGDYFINQNLNYYYNSAPRDGELETLLNEKKYPVFTTMYFGDDEGNWRSLMYPILDGERLVGILETSSPAWDINRSVDEIITRITLGCCVVLAVLLVSFMLVLTVSLSTLRKLSRSAAAIASGDYKVRVETKSSDETGDIARAFNSMAASVESVMADITAVSDGYSRFVPKEILSLMHKDSIQYISSSDYVSLKAMFMLMTTESFDKYRGQKYIETMNRFYSSILPVLSGSGGVVERFNGRELRALFDCRPVKALETALSLFNAVNRLNAGLTGKEPVECGVLLAYSDTFFGVTGNDDRLNMVFFSRYAYKVDALREIGLRYGCRLILDQSAYEGLCGAERQYRHRHLGYILDSGEKRAVYDFYDSETVERARDRDMTREAFERAIDAYYKGEYDTARGLFIDILKQSPDDFAAREYLKKSHGKVGTDESPDVLLEI